MPISKPARKKRDFAVDSPWGQQREVVRDAGTFGGKAEKMGQVREVRERHFYLAEGQGVSSLGQSEI